MKEAEFLITPCSTTSCIVYISWSPLHFLYPVVDTKDTVAMHIRSLQDSCILPLVYNFKQYTNSTDGYFNMLAFVWTVRDVFKNKTLVSPAPLYLVYSPSTQDVLC